MMMAPAREEIPTLVAAVSVLAVGVGLWVIQVPRWQKTIDQQVADGLLVPAQADQRKQAYRTIVLTVTICGAALCLWQVWKRL